MSGRIERLMKEYPSKRTELKCLELQLRSFRGLSEADMIDSMTFAQPDGERVQTSGISRKTEAIALDYTERLERLNQGWYQHLERSYAALSEELRFFESAVRSLEGELAEIMTDMVLNCYTWDALEAKYHISRSTIGKYRRKAITKLEKLYQIHDAAITAYMLS